ncbi:uncharacterized protein EV420DRAFT_1528198 [Desarmillaria tabescens]|uniref:Uncharacterized protein n=1 Tax=Armillaria tabescens TaxID=1929756 RepID=A0AA39T3K5_ARMTA|nr:uncharacterized protein EV420DRAFT_1528198 [Desarmillaria tabescens]KAK0461981.1 hypothetical protein EV420DRAFT_1528198 [Desarmillaria tabescens]
MAPKKVSYTFLNRKIFLSERSKAILTDLLDQAQKRDPDANDMYIYNDYYSYTLNNKVKKKAWNDAMDLLEALTLFFDMEDSWPMCDDGKRITHTDKAYGSLLITVLRALKQDGRLDTTNYPSLETLLKYAVGWGESVPVNTGYSGICKAIGYRLFKNKTAEQVALEKARVDEWMKGLDKETRKRMEEEDDEDDEDDDDDEEGGWFQGGNKCNEDATIKNLVLSRAWKDYKDYLRGVPSRPMKGPGEWDISKWTYEQKKPFLFSEMDI